MKALRVLACVGCVLAWAHTAFSQQSIDQVSIRGRIVDRTGAVIPGATVTARNTGTGVIARTVSDYDGRFRLPDLKVGPYEITIYMQGFAEARLQLTSTNGAAFEISIVLIVASLDTTLIVAADTVVLEAAGTQNSATLSEADVQALPPNGRNPLDAGLVIRCRSDEHPEGADVFRNVRCAGRWVVSEQPAPSVQRLRRRPRS